MTSWTSCRQHYSGLTTIISSDCVRRCLNGILIYQFCFFNVTFAFFSLKLFINLSILLKELRTVFIFTGSVFSVSYRQSAFNKDYWYRNYSRLQPCGIPEIFHWGVHSLRVSMIMHLQKYCSWHMVRHFKVIGILCTGLKLVI